MDKIRAQSMTSATTNHVGMLDVWRRIATKYGRGSQGFHPAIAPPATAHTGVGRQWFGL